MAAEGHPLNYFNLCRVLFLGLVPEDSLVDVDPLLALKRPLCLTNFIPLSVDVQSLFRSSARIYQKEQLGKYGHPHCGSPNHSAGHFCVERMYSTLFK
jgi:hypothetical protein